MPPVRTAADPIPTRRLRNQRITRTGLGPAEQVVDWLGAVQAQEYEPATWALALRMKGIRSAGISRMPSRPAGSCART